MYQNAMIVSFKECDCNKHGVALGTGCNKETGYCECKPGYGDPNNFLKPVADEKCDSCWPGSYGFPNCMRK